MVGAKKELVAKVAVHAFAALARRPLAQNDPSVAARWRMSLLLQRTHPALDVRAIHCTAP